MTSRYVLELLAERSDRTVFALRTARARLGDGVHAQLACVACAGVMGVTADHHRLDGLHLVCPACGARNRLRRLAG